MRSIDTYNLAVRPIDEARIVETWQNISVNKALLSIVLFRMGKRSPALNLLLKKIIVNTDLSSGARRTL